MLLINIQPGMNVCVVDLGGGTIDTMSSEIIQLYPLRMKEASVATGKAEDSRS